ncbi:TOBE domain-containing protein [Bradyrhizobium sp. 179]|uniref:TOBE domain-containing protein n=1 Tax=Bradyrhizobium sp. 179 TaxID=2782648 RepID=UPI0032089C8F
MRPENIDLTDCTMRRMSEEREHNVLAGVVLDVAALRADLHVVVELPGRNRLLAIRKNLGRTPGVMAGQAVQAVFSASDVLVF